MTMTAVPPSDGELAALQEERDIAHALREAWWAAQCGSLGKDPREVAADPRGREIEKAAAEAERRYRAACRRRWPNRRGSRRQVTPRLPGL
ncbi:MAG: hypothetical protein M0027_12675 [Candidatus Dormibacteraeota bacterium]|nr:hypothetical protein [Candidatus Dormibacteraeota bacterium]